MGATKSTVALSRALALFLAPDSVTDGDYGVAAPEAMKAYMDYCSWDRFTPDGSWRRYTSADAAVATAEAGRQFLTSLQGGRQFLTSLQGGWQWCP